MKKGDIIWGIVVGLVIFLLFRLLNGQDTNSLTIFAKSHPYVIGFLKVSILATLGEILALRIVKGNYEKPVGIVYKFIVWGFIGMTFTVVFDIFAKGVVGVMNSGLLPSAEKESTTYKFLFAFFTSAFMNIVFAPTFMAFHRITDTYIELGGGRLNKIKKVKLKEVVNNIDWYGYLNFVVLKTIPVFWIPAHTITFLLPPQYRVLTAAILSMVLGAILALSKPKKNTISHKSIAK
ncbi:Mpv17/PMP22 family protein [Clostridium sp. Marseille-Q7071]